ncbi:hypothetical protein QBC35DRAFT_378719 [Podospora australis]|uniref:Uncharacterized protein n=1 Tax=Podospora australis TaxID=1536484 RepID=A0AAN6WXQ3_9PEZI|nr:hypothetical protein QBC35DRAFT_378719 [Podospora australis]
MSNLAISIISSLLFLFLPLISPATAQNITSISLTRIVEIFYINERAYEGLPYTLFHRGSGSVLSVSDSLTTYVITTTRIDRRRPHRTDDLDPALSSFLSAGADSPPLSSNTPSHGHHFGSRNGTGQASTITQGPATFLYTGTRYSPQHGIVNRCSLNGTVSARCNLTHVGSAWYTNDRNWNGTFSTYSYNWTSGDRLGFAPVTITKGVELLGEETGAPSASGGSTNGAKSGKGDVPAVVGVLVWAGLLGLGVF